MDAIEQKLADLKTALETSNKKEAQTLIDGVKAEFKTEIENEVKEVKDTLTAEFEAKLKLVQDHADKLDIKLQDKKATEKKGSKDAVSVIKSLITDNKDAVLKVQKGKEILP